MNELEIRVSKRYPTRIWDATMQTIRGTYVPIGIEGRTGKAVIQALAEQFRFAEYIRIDRCKHGWRVWIRETEA